MCFFSFCSPCPPGYMKVPTFHSISVPDKDSRSQQNIVWLFCVQSLHSSFRKNYLFRQWLTTLLVSERTANRPEHFRLKIFSRILREKTTLDLSKCIPALSEYPVITVNPSGPHLVCLLYTSPSPRDRQKARMPSSA